MSQWHSLNMGDALLADSQLEWVVREFDRLYSEEQNPGAASVFLRRVSEGKLHYELIVYFSPQAEDLARQLPSTPCAAPSIRGLGLLRCPQMAWDLLESDGRS